jgi:nicotinamide mononucleotide adenylyltransferase
MSSLAAVTGRFQPVHAQHVELFGLALAGAERLAVAITNPDAETRQEVWSSTHRHTEQANPFSYYERARMLHAALSEAGLASRVTLVPFDLTRPGVWGEYVPRAARQFVRVYDEWERQKAGWLAEAGYPVTVLEGDPATRVSGTEVRAALRAGRDPGTLLPPAAARVLAELLAERAMAER